MYIPVGKNEGYQAFERYLITYIKKQKTAKEEDIKYGEDERSSGKKWEGERYAVV